MTGDDAELTRLRDGAERPGSTDERLARQLRLLAAEARVPVVRRVASGRSRPPMLQVLRLAAFCAGVLTVGGGASATAVLLVRRWQAAPPSPVAPAAQAARPTLPAGDTRHALRSPPAPPPAPPEVLPAPPPPAPAPPAKSARRVALASPQPPAPPGIAAEADLLRRALLSWRSAGGDRGALAILDAYDAQFRNGALTWEAAAMRARVLLHMGNREAALALLDRLPLSQAGVSADLIVTRGELRSLAGRCGDALGDFDWVLHAAARLASADQARALFGRASCRERTGDVAGAEGDRELYLRAFPDGPAAGHLQRQP